MDREEAQSIGSGMSSNLSTYTMLDNRIKLLVDEIYDDFESRTCSNCKHSKIAYGIDAIRCYDPLWCSRDVCNIHDSDRCWCTPDFGCTEFERRK